MEIDLESIESQSVDIEVEEIDGSSFNTQTQSFMEMIVLNASQ
mgnify:CR=1 FL=1